MELSSDLIRLPVHEDCSNYGDYNRNDHSDIIPKDNHVGRLLEIQFFVVKIHNLLIQIIMLGKDRGVGDLSSRGNWKVFEQADLKFQIDDIGFHETFGPARGKLPRIRESPSQIRTDGIRVRNLNEDDVSVGRIQIEIDRGRGIAVLNQIGVEAAVKRVHARIDHSRVEEIHDECSWAETAIDNLGGNADDVLRSHGRVLESATAVGSCQAEIRRRCYDRRDCVIGDGRKSGTGGIYGVCCS